MQVIESQRQLEEERDAMAQREREAKLQVSSTGRQDGEEQQIKWAAR